MREGNQSDNIDARRLAELLGLDHLNPVYHGEHGLRTLEELVRSGQLQRAMKQVLVRGLNANCNHDLKNLFKGAAVVASSKPGPFEQFYAALVAKGMRPENGAADPGQEDCHHRADRVEERSALRRPTSETTNSLSVFDRVRFILGIFSGGGRGFSRHSGSRASLS